MSLPTLEIFLDRIMSIYGENVDIFSPTTREENLTVEECKRNRMGELIKIIFANLDTRPIKLPFDGEITIFETDLHGDLSAFLYTILTTGMAKFSEKNPIGIIFYDPFSGFDYTIERILTMSVENAGSKELSEICMRGLQLLPDLVPTYKYSKYVNCGDFVDSGRQSLQLLYLIDLLDRRCRDGGILTHYILMGNHENFYTLPFCLVLEATRNYRGGQSTHIYDYSYNYANASLTGDPKMVEFNEQKFKQIKDPIVRALGSGLLSMAHNIGKTVFSHTIITREIVKSLSDIFNELGATIDSVKYSRYGEKTKKSIVKLRREFMHLKEKIDGGIEFAEADASELVRALNEFILFRLEIGLLECESHLTGENRIIEIMMGRSGSRGKLLLQRRVETMEEDLIPGLKYIVGHDYDINHNYNLDFDGRVLYADSSRSHGYNHNYSYVNFSLVSNKYLKNSSRLELPSRTGEHNTGKDPEMACFYRAITPDNLEERAMTNFKKIEKHLLSLLC